MIGAGLGGLECAYLLSKVGKSVLVLEADALIGGCLQTFRRSGHLFDTGFHYVGGLDEGQMLHKLFGYFDLLNLPWRKMDQENFDEVTLPGGTYPFAQGYDRFRERMTEFFPHQKENLERYVGLLKEVGDNIIHSLDPRSSDEVYEQSLFARSAYDFLSETITDPALIDVLSGSSIKMELCAPKLPLYVFAQINSTFIQSAYRIEGGGMQIAESLRASIEKMGGKVMRNSRVTAIEGVEGKASAVVINNGEARFEADTFISNIHPAATARLLHENGLVRKIYHKRITGLENTFGMLTVNIALKPGTIKYQNRNLFIYKENGVWQMQERLGKDVEAVMVSFMPPTDGGEFATGLDILTPMRWDDVSQWFGTKIGCRGDEYVDLKNRVADQCVSLAETRLPGLRDSIDGMWISTPLTYADYTGTEQGSAYGIRKDYNSPMLTVLTPKTPTANVFLTGQSLNLHGILGTSMTSMFTCAEIVGMPTVVAQINQ